MNAPIKRQTTPFYSNPLPIRSRDDLTDQEIIKDARHQLHRCKSDEDYAAWAKRWGEPAMGVLLRASELEQGIFA